jgi:hypothetical protein
MPVGAVSPKYGGSRKDASPGRAVYETPGGCPRASGARHTLHHPHSAVKQRIAQGEGNDLRVYFRGEMRYYGVSGNRLGVGRILRRLRVLPFLGERSEARGIQVK